MRHVIQGVPVYDAADVDDNDMMTMMWRQVEPLILRTAIEKNYDQHFCAALLTGSEPTMISESHSLIHLNTNC